MRKEVAKSFAVYIVECADQTLYTGYTTDIDARIKTHNEGKAGAKYTRIRRPVRLVYLERVASKSEALKREYAIKQMTRPEKLSLVQTVHISSTS
jgi:putative endonuclease